MPPENPTSGCHTWPRESVNGEDRPESTRTVLNEAGAGPGAGSEAGVVGVGDGVDAKVEAELDLPEISCTGRFSEQFWNGRSRAIKAAAIKIGDVRINLVYEKIKNAPNRFLNLAHPTDDYLEYLRLILVAVHQQFVIGIVNH